MTDRGACFGFAVRAALALKYVREGSGEALEVALSADEGGGERGELLHEWLPRPGHSLHARLYRNGHLYSFWVGGMGSYVIDPGARRVAVPPAEDAVLREERLWGLPAGLCFLERGDLPVHAAAVEARGKAVLLAAPGRFGKSTLAAAFHQAGHRVLSEDLTCLRLTPVASVIPGPAMLRIRRDVADRLPLPAARVLREDDERVSLALDEGRRGECRPVPLGAVVLLREAPAGTRLECVSPTAAIPDLWSLSFHLPTAEGRARAFRAVAELASRTPTWNLYRRLRLEELSGTVDYIVEHCIDDG